MFIISSICLRSSAFSSRLSIDCLASHKMQNAEPTCKAQTTEPNQEYKSEYRLANSVQKTEKCICLELVIDVLETARAMFFANREFVGKLSLSQVIASRKFVSSLAEFEISRDRRASLSHGFPSDKHILNFKLARCLYGANPSCYFGPKAVASTSQGATM